MTSPDLTYLAVHWKDGMKLTEDHFVAHDHHIHDRVRDTTWVSLNEYNFGLLPSSTSTEPIQLDFLGDEFIVKSCKALTAGGNRIHLTPAMAPLRLSVLTIPTDSFGRRDADYYIGVVIDPFNLTATGEPNPAQTPLRFPYALPQLRLELMSKTQVESNQVANTWLAVGKVRIEGNGWVLDKQYIPPCTKVVAHSELRKFHSLQAANLENVIEKAIQVIKNIQNPTANQDLRLAQSASGMANCLLSLLASTYDHYNIQIPQQSPVYMVLFFKQLARSLTYYLKTLPDAEREGLFNYFRKHTARDYSYYATAIEDVLKVVYTHNDMRPAVLSIENFMMMLLTTFDKLAELSFIKSTSEGPVSIWQKLK